MEESMCGVRAQRPGGSGKATDVVIGIVRGCRGPYIVSDGLFYVAIGVSIGGCTIRRGHSGRHLCVENVVKSEERPGG